MPFPPASSSDAISIEHMGYTVKWSLVHYNSPALTINEMCAQGRTNLAEISLEHIQKFSF